MTLYQEEVMLDLEIQMYLKPLNRVWDILSSSYDTRNTMIVDDFKEKHVCNDEWNYIITKGNMCDDVNGTFLLDQLWHCLIHPSGVSYVRLIVIKLGTIFLIDIYIYFYW